MRAFYLKEYDKVTCSSDGHPQQVEHGVLLLKDDFDSLKKTLLAADEAGKDAGKVLKLCSLQGQEAIQVQNYVGVILLPSGNCLEVLPKICINQDDDYTVTAERILLKILRVLPDFPPMPFAEASLNHGKLALLEVFIKCFLQDVGSLIRRGICSDYVGQEDNLNFLRGKLLLKEHIQHNTVRRDKFYVAYDEFLPDRPENRLVKSALHAVLHISRNAKSRILCKRYLSHFAGVGRAKNVALEFIKCRKDRNMQHYTRTLQWCEMLLRGNSPLPSFGKFGCQSILFSMHKLFEDYVAVKMRDVAAAAGWEFTSQMSGQSLVEEHDGNSRFALRPDLFFSRSGQRLIADTKWKVVNSSRDIDQGDLYQLFAYTEKYIAPGSYKLCFLVYPKTSQSPKLPPFYFRTKDSELRAAWYDLETDECELTSYLHSSIVSGHDEMAMLS